MCSFYIFVIEFLSTGLLPDDFHARGKREDELQYFAIIVPYYTENIQNCYGFTQENQRKPNASKLIS